MTTEHELGISTETLVQVPRLIVAIQGQEQQGKTEWAFTAPAPLGVIGMDTGTNRIIRKFQAAGKDVHYKLIHPPATQEEAEERWEEYQQVYYYFLQNMRSLVIDTDTESWELQRMAAFGRLASVPGHMYTTINQKRRRMIRDALLHDCNLILVFKEKRVFDSPGEWERAGFNATGYDVHVSLRAYKDQYEEDRSNGKPYHVEVLKCGPKPQLEGEDWAGGPFNTFPWLAALVLGGTPKDYEDE